MDAARRRKTILKRLGAASAPIPAAALGAELGVSRQIVVGDVALLRAPGPPGRPDPKRTRLNTSHTTK